MKIRNSDDNLGDYKSEDQMNINSYAYKGWVLDDTITFLIKINFHKFFVDLESCLKLYFSLEKCSAHWKQIMKLPRKIFFALKPPKYFLEVKS